MKHDLPSSPAVVGALTAALLLCACSAFESSRRMDMSPFAQNAVTMFAEAARISVPFQFVELKRYQGSIDFAELRNKGVPVIEAMKGLVMYSQQLVALSNAPMKDPEKNQRLAEYLSQVRQRALPRNLAEALDINFAGLDTVLLNIRKAPTFLDGIAAAAPLVDAVVYAIGSRLEEISSLVPPAMAAFDRLIETDQAEQKHNLLELRRLQARYHLAVTLLYRSRLGETVATDSLILVEPSLSSRLNTKGAISEKNYQDAEDILALRLQRISEYMGQLAFERQIYSAKQKELQEWKTQIEEKIKIARDALMVWAQSHHNLGKGIPVPPMIDVAGIAGGLARKVVPVP